MILDISKNPKGFSISYVKPDGLIGMEHFPVNKITKWVECKANDPLVSTKYKNWNGSPVKEVEAKSINKFKQYEFIWKLQRMPKYAHIFDLNMPKLAFIDIETKVPTNGSSNFEEFTNSTPTPVTTIAIVLNNTCFVMGSKPLHEYEIDIISKRIDDACIKLGFAIKFRYIYYENEFDMIDTFFKSVLPKCGVITGWNVVHFDWKYLMNRYKKLGGQPLDASPTQSSYSGFMLNHIGVIDYANIFNKWDQSIEVKENNSLDFVASEIIGINKVSYNGSLNELYDMDYLKYVEYNAMDAIIVKAIDMKKKLINLMSNIAHLCHIPIAKADKATVIGESLLSHGFFERNRIVAMDYNTNEDDDTSYEGAFVKEPKTGFYRYLACFDFSSLYPTIMRQWNISPESYMGIFDKSSNEFIKYKASKNYITAINGTVYRKEVSVLNLKLSSLFKGRKDAQKEMKNYQSQAEKLKKVLFDKYGVIYEEIKNKK